MIPWSTKLSSKCHGVILNLLAVLLFENLVNIWDNFKLYNCDIHVMLFKKRTVTFSTLVFSMVKFESPNKIHIPIFLLSFHFPWGIIHVYNRFPYPPQKITYISLLLCCSFFCYDRWAKQSESCHPSTIIFQSCYPSGFTCQSLMPKTLYVKTGLHLPRHPCD